MTGDDWQTVGQVASYVVLGTLVTWKAHRAEQQAKKAKEYSQPTGNGFAATVKDALARIEAAQAKDSTMLYDHIRAHANADVMKGAHREPSQDPNAS